MELDNTISVSDKEMLDAGIINEIPAPGKAAPVNTGDDPADLEDWQEKNEAGEIVLKAGIELDEAGKPKNLPAPKDKLQEWEEMGENGKKVLKPGIVLGTDGKPITKIENEITEDAVLKYLKEQGIDAKSIGDLKPKPEPEHLTSEQITANKEKRTQDAVQFAFQNNVFSKKEYDKFISFQSLPKVDVVKEDFIAKLKLTEPDIDDKDAEERFKEVFHLYEDEDTWKYKFGMSEVEKNYDNILNTKYGKIAGIEDVYDNVTKNLNNAKKFKSVIDDVFSSKIKKHLEFEILGEKIKATLFNNAQSDQIKNNYLTSEMMTSLLADDGSIDEEALILEIEKDFIYHNLNEIVAEAAKTLADLKVLENKKARKSAKFDEDLVIDDIDEVIKPRKSASDLELDEAKRKHVI